ncbi:MAG: aromatic ring-hydroxylating dioxygenase subunit alpha [Planctomycetota bacterium JB042]
MEDLDALLRRFDAAAPISRARTPPSEWYTSGAWLEREKERLFRRRWIVVARVDQVRRSGDHVAGVLVDQPFVVVRGDDGALRAFHNVCRHHATAVASGEGRCEELVCPYHGWTYGLDGRLLRAPRLGKVEGFDRAAHGLVPMHVRVWGPLVLVSLAAEPRDLDRDLAPLADRLPPDELGALSFVERRTYRIGCNWKVFADNYLDGGYHVPHMHRELAGKLDLDAYAVESFERLSIQSTRGGGDPRVGAAATYAFVHPNLMLNRYGPWLDVDVVLPIDAETCEVVMEWWIDPTARVDDAEVERQLAESERVQHEDVAVCEAVQRGLRSIAFDTGPYASSEAAMLEFHRGLAADLER